MNKYPKIQTVFLRDQNNKYRTLLKGQFARPEFEYLARNLWEFTEKIDGTNIRVDWIHEIHFDFPGEHNLGFSGRTDNAQIPAFLFAKLQEMFPEEKFAHLYPETSMTLYGEGYGARIQKGGGNYIPDGVGFILFDVQIGDNWLDRENVQDIANFLEVDTVPVVGQGTLFDAIEMVRDGFQSHVGIQIAEGLVMRPVIELIDRRGRRIITKIKHKDFVG